MLPKLAREKDTSLCCCLGSGCYVSKSKVGPNSVKLKLVEIEGQFVLKKTNCD